MSRISVHAPAEGAHQHTAHPLPGAMNQARIRLLVVDDHPVVRLGFNALLSLQDDIEMVGTAENGRAALDLLRRVRVDILLVDLHMPSMSCMETLERVRKIAPTVRSIALSNLESDEEIYAAVKAGSEGFLHKEAPAGDILSAIRSVHAGRKAFPRRIAERFSIDRMAADLSPRELEVLQLVAKGLTNKEIATTLSISQFTVRNHLNHTTQKLEVTNRTEAIFVAVRTGIITV